jgi:hypothetical protein
VLAPITAYLYLVYPDWSWLYLFPADRVPRLAVIPVVAAGFGAMIGGWMVMARAIVARTDPRRVLAGLAGVAALISLLAFVAGRRIGVVGSHADFVAGRAPNLFEVKLGFVLTALAIAAVTSAFLVGAELRKDARKASAR